jgi:hemoglobin-like flavoprotein
MKRKSAARTKSKQTTSRGSKKFNLKNTIMTADKIELLRHSFRQIEPKAGIAALDFYRNLFTLDPSLRPLFHTSIELQGRKLMEALGYTIASLEDATALMPVLTALGRRHVTYGVREEHYPSVIQALLLTLEQNLGTKFTPDMRLAWTEALSFVSETMKCGARAIEALANH